MQCLKFLMLLPIFLLFYPAAGFAAVTGQNAELSTSVQEILLNAAPEQADPAPVPNNDPAAGAIQAELLSVPNQAPVADFSWAKEVVAQGETVVYEDKSYDADGEIVDTAWQGLQRAYFKPGEYTVSLKVKDNAGIWSEPCTKVIKVTEQVLMDKLTYSLHNPIPGEPLDISSIPVLELKLLKPAVSMQRDKVLISNSPETVLEDGILYSDTLRGKNRLYYHHYNGTQENKNIYLLATNQSQKPVTLKIQSWGAGGPSDPMAVGRVAAFKYLDFDGLGRKTITVNPGESIILNQDVNNQMQPEQTLHGFFDIETSGAMLFSVVAISRQDQLEHYQELPVLPRDGKHIRGTFPMSNRFLSVQVPGNEPSRIIIADGTADPFLIGRDENTSFLGHYPLQTSNRGNYGVIYQISLSSKQRVGVLFSPRGGIFAGAAKWNRQIFTLPNTGILQPKMGAMLGVIEPGKREVLTFIPPAGSFLPVNLIFVPF